MLKASLKFQTDGLYDDMPMSGTEYIFGVNTKSEKSEIVTGTVTWCGMSRGLSGRTFIAISSATSKIVACHAAGSHQRSDDLP